MNIGILGTGNVGGTLGERFSKLGHHVFSGSREPEKLSDLRKLAAELGFDPIDSGPLSNARFLEPLAALWIWLAYPGGRGRDIAFRLVSR
jgi:predicted dinucleotide-binding enzyme